MPYFDSDGHNVRAAQKESWDFFKNLIGQYESKLSILNEFDVEFMLRSTSGVSEDRLPFLKSIWGKYDLLMIESTKIPTTIQIKTLIDCKYDLCSQNYETNIMQRDGTVFKFPAHKQYAKSWSGNIREGCPIDNLFLRYAKDDEDLADVTDLGIIKISRNFQLAHMPDFESEAQEGNYNTVERLHKWLRTIDPLPRWHRHKDLARRNPLHHHRIYLGASEYLTESEMKQKLGVF